MQWLPISKSVPLRRLPIMAVEAKGTLMEKRAFTVREFCNAFGVSKSTLYNLIGAGKIRPTKIGSKTLIASDEAARWWASLSSAGAARGVSQ